MTEQEKIIHAILKYLAQPNIRRENNLQEEFIEAQFYDTDKDLYNSAIIVLKLENLMTRTSANGQWQISEKGEIELNRLQEKIDAIKSSPIASELQENLDSLQIKYLKIQISQAGNRYRDKIIGFVAGAVLSIALMYLGKYITNDTDSKEQTIKVSVDMPKIVKDTIFISDTLKK